MKIDMIEVYYAKNHLISPWRTAYGEDPDIYSVFVRMHSGSNCGWSEASPLFAPTYSPEYAFGVYHLVAELFAPLLVGKELDTFEDVNSILSIYKGNPFAKSTFEIAWWMLQADIDKKPLHELLGGTYHELDVGADLSITDDINELLKKIQGAISNGFQRVKLKVKPGHDIDVLREVRRCFPNDTFHIDCNSGYTLEDLPLFEQIDQLGLAMIEQPLFHADLHDHATLQARLKTPICLDESCNSVYAAKKAVELGSCRYINIKMGKVGGLGNALKIREISQEAGIGNWVGSMLETALGAGISIELATLGNMTYPGDLFSSGTFYEEDISQKRIEYSSPGKMLPSSVPGVPYLPDEAILKKRTIQYKRIEKK